MLTLKTLDSFLESEKYKRPLLINGQFWKNIFLQTY